MFCSAAAVEVAELMEAAWVGPAAEGMEAVQVGTHTAVCISTATPKLSASVTGASGSVSFARSSGSNNRTAGGSNNAYAATKSYGSTTSATGGSGTSYGSTTSATGGFGTSHGSTTSATGGSGSASAASNNSQCYTRRTGKALVAAQLLELTEAQASQCIDHC